MPEQKTLNLSDTVFDRLEHLILCGELKDGDVLTESKICIEYGTSRTPVREALKRLQQEGLVSESSRTFTVVGLTEADIIDIYDVRMLIEGLAFARCAQNVSFDQLVKLEEAVDLQEYYISKGLTEKSKDKDSEFHSLVYKFSGSGIIPPLLEKLHRRVQYYRELSITNTDRAESMITEHREILKALKAHDSVLAERLAQEHIRNARDNIIKFVLKK